MAPMPTMNQKGQVREPDDLPDAEVQIWLRLNIFENDWPNPLPQWLSLRVI